VLKLRIPDSISVSVLVVDNNSTDHTTSVIDSFASTAKHPVSVVSLKEFKQGHTHSRNNAIAASTGDLILWTDDDVILSTDWIEKYVNAANADSDSAFWGSVIEPVFQSGCPGWVKQNWENVKGCFAHRNLGDQPVVFTPSRLPYGANFAIRGRIQNQFQYSTELGRRGVEVFGEDELELFRRLLLAGHGGKWVPNAVVQHIISPERATEKYVYDYFVGQGHALVANQEPWHNDLAKLKTESRSEYAKYKLKRAFVDSQTWVSHMIRSGLAQGQYEALKK
jgi:glycosyltransferase involved in cell wall biosynthesis